MLDGTRVRRKSLVYGYDHDMWWGDYQDGKSCSQLSRSAVPVRLSDEIEYMMYTVR